MLLFHSLLDLGGAVESLTTSFVGSKIFFAVMEVCLQSSNNNLAASYPNCSNGC